MSVVTLPRRIEPAPQRERAVAAHRATHKTTVVTKWRSNSAAVRVAVILILAASIVLLGNAYATQRQIEIHQMQVQLLKEQAAYAAQIAALTNSTAPAVIASRAAGLHLGAPSTVTQIQSVPLNVPLPPPALNGRYHLLSRVYP